MLSKSPKNNRSENRTLTILPHSKTGSKEMQRSPLNSPDISLNKADTSNIRERKQMQDYFLVRRGKQKNWEVTVEELDGRPESSLVIHRSGHTCYQRGGEKDEIQRCSDCLKRGFFFENERIVQELYGNEYSLFFGNQITEELEPEPESEHEEESKGHLSLNLRQTGDRLKRIPRLSFPERKEHRFSSVEPERKNWFEWPRQDFLRFLMANVDSDEGIRFVAKLDQQMNDMLEIDQQLQEEINLV